MISGAAVIPGEAGQPLHMPLNRPIGYVGLRLPRQVLSRSENLRAKGQLSVRYASGVVCPTQVSPGPSLPYRGARATVKALDSWKVKHRHPRWRFLVVLWEEWVRYFLENWSVPSLSLAEGYVHVHKVV